MAYLLMDTQREPVKATLRASGLAPATRQPIKHASGVLSRGGSLKVTSFNDILYLDVLFAHQLQVD